MERADRVLLTLYIAEFTLFVTHSIDSTRFGEWTLFHLTQTQYVLSYLPLTAFLLCGLVALVVRRRFGEWASLVLALLGVTVLVVHTTQLAAGSPDFRTPESLALIAASPVVAVPLGWMALRRLLAKET